LESLNVIYRGSDTSGTPSLDLSDATKLKDVAFHCGRSTKWITTTVKTAKSENLQQITVNSPTATLGQIEEAVYREWEDLDHLLVQLWTSRSIRPRVTYERGKREDGMKDLPSRLLPELTRRGVVEIVEFGGPPERQ